MMNGIDEELSNTHYKDIDQKLHSVETFNDFSFNLTSASAVSVHQPFHVLE